jgi:hypothetical protein
MNKGCRALSRSIAWPLDLHGSDCTTLKRGSTGAKQGRGTSRNFSGISRSSHMILKVSQLVSIKS